MSIKLQIGNVYLTRDGESRVKIIRHSTKSDFSYQKTHPFLDEEGYSYMKDGRSHPTKTFPFDLIKDVSKEKKKCQKK